MRLTRAWRLSPGTRITLTQIGSLHPSCIFRVREHRVSFPRGDPRDDPGQERTMDDGASPMDGFSSLLRLSGVLVPARARFAGEATLSGLYTGTTLGLVCGQLGMMCTPWGPLVPFLCGSGLGFGLGLYATWRQAVRTTLVYAGHYPHILAHALWTDSRILVPPSVLPEPKEEHDVSSSAGAPSTALVDWVQRQGMREFALCVLAAMTCQKDVQEVDQLVRQRLIEESSSQQKR
jgi:hypothetical protein